MRWPSYTRTRDKKRYRYSLHNRPCKRKDDWLLLSGTETEQIVGDGRMQSSLTRTPGKQMK